LSLTIAGDITGSGSLTKGASSNTLVLLGTNSYSGTTTITAGTLQVGNGGTSGSLPATAVVNNATLAINRAGSLSMSGAISGSGKLDLANNELRTTATVTAIRSLIINGGIFTTHTSPTTALGYADQGGGITEVRYTLKGDANLDGTVDVGDLGALATNYGI